MKLQVGNTYTVKGTNVLFPKIQIVAYRPEYCAEFPFMGSDECWYSESGQLAGGSSDSPYNLVVAVSSQLEHAKMEESTKKLVDDLKQLLEELGGLGLHLTVTNSQSGLDICLHDYRKNWLSGELVETLATGIPDPQ